MQKKVLGVGVLVLALFISACAQTIQSKEPVYCSADVQQCPDGTYVSRDANNNCEFFPCPQLGRACTKEGKICPDGSVVGRNPAKNCEFDPCPLNREDRTCTTDADCIKVQDGCCNCNNGGKARAINKGAEKAWTEKIATDCKATYCLTVISNDPSCKAISRCINKLCTLE